MKPVAMVANAQRELWEPVSYLKSLVQDKNRDLNRLQKHQRQKCLRHP